MGNNHAYTVHSRIEPIMKHTILIYPKLHIGDLFLDGNGMILNTMMNQVRPLISRLSQGLEIKDYSVTIKSGEKHGFIEVKLGKDNEKIKEEDVMRLEAMYDQILHS